MAFQGSYVPFNFKAGEDLNTPGHEGVAIALDDGKVANNGQEARGILMTKPADGQHGQIGIRDIMKFRAGGAVAAGATLTVTTSGYFTVSASGDYLVGHCGETAATSGSLATGIFHFASNYQMNSLDG